MFYWILTTHLVALFPLAMILYTFKKYRHFEALYCAVTLIFTLYTSVCYHTYDYDSINAPVGTSENAWIILDSWLSSSTVITTNLYCLKVRPPMFYIVAQSSNIVTLFLILNEQVLAYNLFVFIMLVFTYVIKFKNVYDYLREYYIRCFLTLCTGGVAVYAIFRPYRSEEYIIWHPIWHCCIFTTAFLGSSMRYSFDSKFLEDVEYARAAANSI